MLGLHNPCTLRPVEGVVGMLGRIKAIGTTAEAEEDNTDDEDIDCVLCCCFLRRIDRGCRVPVAGRKKEGEGEE